MIIVMVVGGRILRLVILVAVLSSLLPISAPAQAHASAEYPTLMQGARGADVKALQRLLKHHGYTLTADAIFGSATKAAVEDFQNDEGLTVDGIVGPTTWAALVVTIEENDTGKAVKAMEGLLRQKWDPDDPEWTQPTVDGTFSSSDTDIVKDFQSHMGITADGIVGPVTWKNLLWHYVRLDNTSDTCVFPSSWNMDRTWGTATSVGSFNKAADIFSGLSMGKFAFQDFSAEHGGDIGHLSHKVGMDIDVWLVRDDYTQCTQPTYPATTDIYDLEYDQWGTEWVIYLINEYSEPWLKLMYFNDPDLIEWYSFVNYFTGHENHVHVRWCTAYYPSDSKYDC